ncbi:MAG: PorV/PorQ family protein [Ignavibacteriae bacterium]|nr:hypothetical protein [Ignavibacteriota bacterium]NOG96629.1 PorV/PorQ family protein [Ignavibacteriota bacterium]
MKRLLTIFLIVLINSALLFAGDASRKGTTGAEQLLIPVGARSIATAGSFIANVRGVESIYYNPAGLDFTQRSEAMFDYMDYIADIDLVTIAVGANLGDLGSFGFSFRSINFGDIPVTTNLAPDGTGSTFSPAFYVAGLTYSKVITDRVSAGVNFKLIHEGIMNTSANAIALDFGVQYQFNPNFSLGVVAKNIGSNMQYTGQDLQVKSNVPNTNPGSTQGAFEPVTDDIQLPSYFQLSFAYMFNMDEANNLMLGAAFTNNNAFEDKANLGLEYNWSNSIFIRGGYDLLLENTDENIYGFTAGAGVEYEMSNNLGFVLDYAYRDVQEFSANHVFTMKLILN